MPYCDLDDIQSLIPLQLWNHDAAAPSPSIVDVTEWIGDVDARIDSRLAARYTMPITGAKSLERMRSISSRLAAIRVWGKIAAVDPVAVRAYPKDWDDAKIELEEIATGKADLTDASHLVAAPTGGVGQVSHGFPPLKRRDSDLDESEPIFRTDDQF